ncbi:MAG: general secretion pathway protein GspC [Alteromonadaceae bacterium]|uniref:type II secretion system protein N n=1 Tax=Marinobacter sp. BGYM27 TaxID=2975597 RepID=UPI000C397D48|nr:type II secretion system protein N [Marinobacter sp. BGYM27]MAA64235.1 general secretion pathway protein GspC [Alteromonadaceae bacterium]MBH84260.1 general secretion pathway protein GspC [Alteromonadaceae bacterium]MDG5498548.1 type II secretion system protein N [Marinobacter sp. BGYM27]
MKQLLKLSQHATLSRGLANVLLIALVVYFAWVIGRLTWIVAWTDVGSSPVPMAQGVTSGAVASQDPLSSIYLFGRPDAGAPVAEAERRAAPETNLRLKLEGVLVAEQSENSGAIVAGTDGTTAYYRVSEVMPGNVELVEVESHRILIRRNGQVESLAFEDGDVDMMVAQVDEPDVSSPDAFVDAARQQLETQGDAALMKYGLRAVESGQSEGYVYDGSSAMLNALNLKAGDVITAINGQALGDLDQDRELLNSWRDFPQINLEIARGGARFTVTYALPQ